jgi:rfaE bifunctional protein nucleotidyltransferase chain/domain
MSSSSLRSVFGNAHEVAAHIAPLRAAGKKLVTTNGCFDLIHAGHVHYLAGAAALGDILVVGVNGDESVRKLKGPGRPLQNEQDRVRIVGALRMVDCAFVFREDDPRAFLEALRPDVHVKGGDYPADIIERPVVEKHGGVVRIVALAPGRSTSSLVDRIRGGAGAGSGL